MVLFLDYHALTQLHIHVRHR